ncbi:PKD domain-containing protein [Alteromonas sp. OM2203]|uniref:PKD domain-containing protein n=1 Tax=Alteromonas sp. OM2203 TaxID=3398817 RepID=UPI003AF3A89D
MPQRILMIGDETVLGFGAGTGSLNFDGARVLSPLGILAGAMPNAESKAVVGVGRINGYLSPLISSLTDSGVQLSVSDITEFNAPTIGRSWFRTLAGGSMTFTFEDVTDIALGFPVRSYANMSYRVDGGDWFVVDENDSNNRLERIEISGLSLGQHTVELTSASVGSFLIYAEAWNAASDTVIIPWAGNGFNTNDITDVRPWELLNAVATEPFDKVIFNFGNNDVASGVSQTDFVTKMSSLLDAIYAAKPTCTVFLTIPNERDTGASYLPAAIQSLNTLYENTIILDARTAPAMGTYDIANSAGNMADAKYPNADGYAEVWNHLAPHVANDTSTGVYGAAGAEPTISITSHTDYACQKIDQNGIANFQVSGVITDLPDGARVFYSLDGGNTSYVLDENPSTTFSGTVPVLKQKNLIVWVEGFPNNTSSVQKITAALVIGAWWQSNEAGRVTNYQTGELSAITTGITPIMYKDGAFKPLADPVGQNSSNGSTWPRIATLYANAGLPVCVINVAVGGTSIGRWIPSANDLYPTLIDAITNSGVGGLNMSVCLGGESNSGGDYGEGASNKATVKNGLNAIINDLYSRYGCDHWLTYFPRTDYINAASVFEAFDEVIAENPHCHFGGDLRPIDVENEGDGTHLKTDAHAIEAADLRYAAFTTEVTQPANQPPVANAGPDQSVAAATQFTLDGTGSQDTDGTIVEWRWTQTAGDTVTLNLDDPARPTATSPSKTTSQRLTFQLVTVDDEGAESSPGTVNIDVAAFAVSEMLKLLDTRQWTVVNDGSVQAFEGRSNREAFRFLVTPSDGIQTSAEGYFLFDQPGVHAVEVISTPTSKISSVDDPHMIRGDVIAARIGDLQTDENGNLTLTFVLYVTDDKDGLVMTAKVIEPYQKASYFRKQG